VNTPRERARNMVHLIGGGNPLGTFSPGGFSEIIAI
jgi:hypothetical protein